MTMIVDPRSRISSNRPPQGIFAFGVEAGVRLIQNDEARMAEKGSRQAEPLPLPAGQPHAALADIGLVAQRKPHDRFMQPHHGSGGDHLIRRASCRRAMFSRTVPPKSSMSCGR